MPPTRQHITGFERYRLWIPPDLTELMQPMITFYCERWIKTSCWLSTMGLCCSNFCRLFPTAQVREPAPERGTISQLDHCLHNQPPSGAHPPTSHSALILYDLCYWRFVTGVILLIICSPCFFSLSWRVVIIIPLASSPLNRYFLMNEQVVNL